MSKWLDRLAAQKTQGAYRAGTDKTDRTPLLSVLAVPPRSSDRVFFDDTPIRLWAITYPDGLVIQVSCTPPATLAQMQAEYPDAVCVPDESKPEPPARPMDPDERNDVLDWLELIGEADPDAIAEVLLACEREGETRDYYLARSRAEPALALTTACPCGGLPDCVDCRGSGAVLISGRVRCGDCRYFARGAHPHIGACLAGEPPPAAAGFWDSDLRYCASHEGARL